MYKYNIIKQKLSLILDKRRSVSLLDYKSFTKVIIAQLNNSTKKTNINKEEFWAIFSFTKDDIEAAKKNCQDQYKNNRLELYDEGSGELSDYESKSLQDGTFIRGKHNIKYYGDELERPISSYENTLITKAMILLSIEINKILEYFEIDKRVNLRVFGDYRNMIFFIILSLIIKMIS